MSVNYYTDTREDTIDAEEYRLYEQMMAYRASLGLPSIPLSQGLTITASRHTLDTVYNVGSYTGHAWSDAPYDSSDPSTYPNMWDAPQRLNTGYTGNGYEISTGYVGNALTVPNMSADQALSSWQGSPGHDAVITNSGVWTTPWQAIGIAIHESVAHVWFGHQMDPKGAPAFEPGVGPGPGAQIPVVETSEAGDVADIAARITWDATTLLDATVSSFSDDDRITLNGVALDRASIQETDMSARLRIDHDGDGAVDATVTLNGSFSAGEIMAVARGGTTLVSFESYLPVLLDRRAVAEADVNGIVNQAFLTGDGATAFQVTLRAAGTATFDNAIGAYEIDTNGRIVDVRMMFDTASTAGGATATLRGIEDGHQVGFFVVQDGATWAEALAASDVLSFVNGSGEDARLSDGRDLTLAVNGVDSQQMVFHSYAASMNSDGLDHALSGVEVGGEAISVGFEDMERGGDRDYNDVVFRIDAIDDMTFMG